MANMEPGNYKGEDGVERFWDGEQWLTPVKSESPRTGNRLALRKPIIIGATAVILIGGGFIAYSAASESQRKADFEENVGLEKRAYESKASALSSFFADAAKDCDAADDIDTGRDYLSMKTWGDESFSGVFYDTYLCVLDAIEMPPQIKDRVLATRALDGTLSDDWEVLNSDGVVSADWSYHPDSGARMTMELESDYFDDFVAPEYE